MSLASVLETEGFDLGAVRTHAPGPQGHLPITPEMLLNAPSGNLFGLSQNAGMGCEPTRLLDAGLLDTSVRTVTGETLDASLDWWEQSSRRFLIEDSPWDDLIQGDDFHDVCQSAVHAARHAIDLSTQTILAPTESQEVWAAGVTYYRSRSARIEESKEAGGGDFYDRVYAAERPEIFFKATGRRVIGPGGHFGIRTDAKWSVPEPELTLLLSATGKVPLTELKRKLPTLAGYLYRDNSFPHGSFLMTGTGVVPPDSFTLQAGDEIRITIAPVGTLINTVAPA